MNKDNSPVKAAIEMVKDSISRNWYICRPTSEEAATKAPSECRNCFEIDTIEGQDLQPAAVTAFIDAITNVFTKNAHHDSYWKDVAIDTEMNVSRSVIGYRDTQLESHTRESLLSPVLNQITARMTMLPDCKATAFEAFLQPECPIRLHVRSGRPASVDYAINIEGDNHMINCIPIEAKRKLDNLHLKQLASYINKVSTADIFSDVSVVGLLLTQYAFQFAFSPYKFENKTVPIVYITPPFEWRSEKCINSKGLLLLSVVHLIKLKRLTFEPTEDDKVLLEISKKLYESPYRPEPLSSKFVSDATYERLSFIQKQQEMIRQQQQQLEANDELLHQQTEALYRKQMELEAADKRMKEELEAADKRMKEELEAADNRIQEELKVQKKTIEHLVHLTSPSKK